MEKITFALGCIFLLLNVAVCRQLNDIDNDIIFTPDQKSYVEGEEVTMTCRHDASSGICAWQQDHQTINFEINQRIKIHKNDSCVISISSLMADDDGFWTCQCPNGITVSKRLTIESKQIGLLIPEVRQVLHADEGSTVELQCSFNDSAPYCFWTKDDNVLVIRGRYRFIGNLNDGNCTIRIGKVTHKDYGKYRCCYPIKDNAPALKSSSITLNITVSPTVPFITLNNLNIENEKTLFLVTETEIENVKRNRNYFQERVLTAFRNTIACWILNGSPEAQLRWTIEDENGEALDYIDRAHKPRTFDVMSTSSNQKSSYLELKLKRDDIYDLGIRRVKLICSADHPSFRNVTQTASVWLIWAHQL